MRGGGGTSRIVLICINGACGSRRRKVKVGETFLFIGYIGLLMVKQQTCSNYYWFRSIILFLGLGKLGYWDVP